MRLVRNLAATVLALSILAGACAWSAPRDFPIDTFDSDWELDIDTSVPTLDLVEFGEDDSLQLVGP